MFVDLWIVGIFAILVGICAVWNRNIGYREGIQDTVEQMLEDKLIGISGNKIVPYRNTEN
jgi:hypothetical protein